MKLAQLKWVQREVWFVRLKPYSRPDELGETGAKESWRGEYRKKAWEECRETGPPRNGEKGREAGDAAGLLRWRGCRHPESEKEEEGNKARRRGEAEEWKRGEAEEWRKGPEEGLKMCGGGWREKAGKSWWRARGEG